ncbi:MAG TPA: hypothetical protein VHE35_36195 [Kofleriaceae bacterium]|nr:hypothetical protein [Kofleriaceae bacterium]
MSSLETKTEPHVATLRLSHAADGKVLAARMPFGAGSEEFGRLAARAFDVISKLTGHPCLSGQIKFVVEDNLINEAIRVNLQTGQLG